MTIEEVRKILGSDYDELLSDDQVKDLIRDLSILASEALRQAVELREVG